MQPSRDLILELVTHAACSICFKKQFHDDLWMDVLVQACCQAQPQLNSNSIQFNFNFNCGWVSLISCFRYPTDTATRRSSGKMEPNPCEYLKTLYNTSEPNPTAWPLSLRHLSKQQLSDLNPTLKEGIWLRSKVTNVRTSWGWAVPSLVKQSTIP